MNETALTQDAIDGHDTESSTEKHGLLSKAVKHPWVTGGALLAGAGLAYALSKPFRAGGPEGPDVQDGPNQRA